MKVSIGIDPGYRTGIVAWDGEAGKIVEIKTVDREEAMKEIRVTAAKFARDLVCFGVEVPATKHTYYRPGTNVRAMRKIAHNVGDCYRVAMDLVQFCLAVWPEITTYAMPPGRTKTSRAIFEYLTGYPQEKRSSSHSRDAGRIAQRAYNKWAYNNLIEEVAGDDA
jgi:hypothetical protein